MPGDDNNALKKAAQTCAADGLLVAGGDVDITLLEASLALTPWERMQANDDALNFAESLRLAMSRRNAKPE